MPDRSVEDFVDAGGGEYAVKPFEERAGVGRFDLATRIKWDIAETLEQ